MLAHGAVDEPAIWWDGKFVFPRLEGNHDDYLDTQLYAHNMKDQTYQLTDAPGWKSGAQITDGYLAYVCADNRSYPYPLTVVVQQLEKLAGNDLL